MYNDDITGMMSASFVENGVYAMSTFTGIQTASALDGFQVVI